MEKDYSKYNARQVLKKVKEKINYLENQRYRQMYYISDIYDELSIYDWWTDMIGITRLRDMEKFLNESIKLGYTGYVCFKVGVKGCSNGMWAYKEETTNGYSPNGACLYKSFVPEYEYWSISPGHDKWFPESDNYNALKTINSLEKYLIENNLN